MGLGMAGAKLVFFRMAGIKTCVRQFFCLFLFFRMVSAKPAFLKGGSKVVFLGRVLGNCVSQDGCRQTCVSYVPPDGTEVDVLAQGGRS